MTNTVDIKKFAPVARATNAVYIYVTADATATVLGDGYFNSKQLSGSVKAGDMIFLNSLAESGGGLMILTVSSVNATTGAIVVAQQLPTPTPPTPPGPDPEPGNGGESGGGESGGDAGGES